MCNEAEIEWIDCILDDVATVSSGDAPPSTTGNIPIFGANGIIGFTDISNHEDSILLGRVGSAGEVNFAEGPCWVSDNALIVTPNTDIITNRYLFHLIRSIDFKSQITKTAQPLMTQTRLKETPLRIPSSISIQDTITNILDSSDDSIVSTRQRIRKLEMIREGILEDLLTLGVGEDGSLRDPGADDFQDTEIGILPAEWRISEGDDLIIQAGFALGPSRNPRQNPTPYVTVAHVKRNYLDLEDQRYMEVSESELSERSISQGDILMIEAHANINEIGRCCLATDEVVGWTYQNHIFRIRSNTINSEFLLLILNSRYAQEHWRSVATTTSGMNTINRTKVRLLRLPVPPLDERLRIIAAIDSIDLRISSSRNELRKHLMMKVGLQNDLLTGALPIPAELIGLMEAVE